MKRIILLTGVLMAAPWTGKPQGTISFGNNSRTLVMTAPDCPVPVGTMFKVALYYLPDTGTTPNSWDFDARGTALGASVGFAPVAGQFHGGTRSTPWTTAPGGDAWFQVRVWETAFGSTYEEVAHNGTPIGGRLGILGYSNIIRTTTGNPTTTPPGLPPALLDAGLQGFCLGWCSRCFIPEPSTISLALLGVVALLLAVRRSR
jgi:hypothetical protein